MNLPAYRHDGYKLLDCRACHAEFPDTFEVPAMELLERLRAGQLVKLVFLFEPEKIAGLDDPLGITRNGRHPSAERMWVRLDGIGPDGLHFGALRNTPAIFTPDVLKLDDRVVFELRHIAALDPEDYPSMRSPS